MLSDYTCALHAQMYVLLAAMQTLGEHVKTTLEVQGGKKLKHRLVWIYWYAQVGSPAGVVGAKTYTKH